MKKYIEGGIYHVYNRGVNKQEIFFDAEDYITFLRLFNNYLKTPTNGSLCQKTKNFHGKIKLLVFSLIPNHPHLILQQLGKHDMDDFMHSLMTSYSLRVNKRHERVGHLFQDTYKARIIENDYDLINTSFYVHNNPQKELAQDQFKYPYSSISSYTGEGIYKFDFVDERVIMSLFDSYHAYIEGLKNYKAVER